MATDLEPIRAAFARRLRDLAGLRSASLVRALATVPREHFVGAGPWKILLPADVFTYRDTPDDDPRHLYDNVLVALDAGRRLNNGEPAALARWLDELDLAPGDRFLHVGCGVGYYTAIAAEAVSPAGSVVGIEVDPKLAERARVNLAGYANVTVACNDGSRSDQGAFDASFVNAGATEVPLNWTERLRPGGRLLVPLTVAVQGMGGGFGQMLLVVRHANALAARFVSPVGIFHCVGARTDEGDDLLRQAYARGGEETVQSLRRDEHPAGSECWLHAPRFCLSRLGVEEGPASPSS